MKRLREYQTVQRLENASALRTFMNWDYDQEETPLDSACLEVFGVRYNDIPGSFFDENEPWDNMLHMVNWARQHGYDLTDQNGHFLQNAEEFAYVIEALERGLVRPDPKAQAKYASKAWEKRLAEDAKKFTNAKRRQKPAA